MDFFALYIAHLIGDFLLQNDWMAKGKKSSSLICAAHSATYTLPFVLCGLAWWQLLLIGGQHFLQDRWSFVSWFMEKTGKGEFAKPPMSPWS
ncbi:MAG: DUF3307 domain-containing protein, partial [Candidatus Methanospirareceae archaeon]